MASNIIAPQPVPSTNLSLAEDIWKMWQSAAPFNELAEKESNLKRALPQVFSQMEPAAKRVAAAPTQIPVSPMLNSQQQHILQQQAALHQAIACGQMPANAFSAPVTAGALNGVQQMTLQNQQQVLAQLEKLKKDHLAQQQQQQQQVLHQQQQQQLQQQQQHLQQLMQQHRAIQQQQNQLQGIPGIPAQLLQGQQLRGAPPLIDLRQAEQYAALLKINPQVLQAQQAQLMSQSAPMGAQPIIQPQMTGRRQTIGPTTITPQIMGALPRMHRPSPQLIPTSSPLQMMPSSSCNPTPSEKSPFTIPAVSTRPPTAPNQTSGAPQVPVNVVVAPAIFKGPDDPVFMKFLQQARQVEQQIHKMLGDGMVRLPGTFKD